MNKLILIAAVVILMLTNASNTNAQQANLHKFDSVSQNLNDSIGSMLDYRTNYLANTEVEHQKLMRNIFIAGFVLMLGLLIFTILFYGGKIKKVSNIILLQNEAVGSTKDQLIKVINIFNYIDQQIYITDSKGNIEWLNTYATKWFNEDFEKNKISLLSKFKPENQGFVFQGINEDKATIFNDNLFGNDMKWKMIPVKNSKGEFSNMFFIGS